jgi:hypothetical protein
MIYHITTTLSTVQHTFSLDGLVQGVQNTGLQVSFFGPQTFTQKSSTAALGKDYDMHDRLRNSSIKDRVIQREGRTFTCL